MRRGLMRGVGIGLGVLLAAACGSSGGGGSGGASGGPAAIAGRGGTPGAAGGPGGAAASGGAGSAGLGGSAAGGGGGRARDWSQVEALLTSAAADAGVSALGLVIWDAADQRLYERMLGGFTADTRVAVASASKMVSGLVLFDAVRRGELTLDTTTGQVLGWTGANGAITLRQLLSFTSGLAPQAACTLNPLTTLAACVDNIAGMDPMAAPGTRFDYGSTHLHVAARMAEVASGKSWAQLFADTLRTPLGLPADVAYYTFPKQTAGMLNPLVAGGLRASINEYAPLLALAFHAGSYGGLTVGTPELFAEQAREPYPAAVIGRSPVANLGLPYHYGLTAWLMCDATASKTGCADLSSPGAFGFTPWFDRGAGYYAVLGMELDSGDVEDGVVDFAVKLQQQLEPLIRAQL